MSPEQVRGQGLDKRTDIWAFGCLLYEVLTGRRAFDRETVADTLAAIIDQRPDWESMPAATPRRVRSLVRRCLRKDPELRLHDIADARIEIDEAIEQPDAVPPAGVPPAERLPAWRRAVPWGIAGLLALLAAAALYWPSPAVAPRPLRMVALPPDVEFLFGVNSAPPFAISPDGSQLVYRAPGESEGSAQLYSKGMDQLRGSPIPGTEGAPPDVFYSPDGRWIGFPARGKLWRVPVTGGSPLPVCDLPGWLRGASWGRDDTIVLAPTAASGLARVAAGGGQLEPLTELDADSGENSHRWPQLLPNGNAVIFTILVGGNAYEAEIAVLSLDSGETRILPVRGTYARYVPTGHVLYARAGALFAVPPSEYDQVLRFSPNGRYLVGSVSQGRIFLYDLERDTFAAIAIGADDQDDQYPMWTPDGERLIFSQARGGFGYNLFRMPVDGSGPAERLSESLGIQYATSVSPDGRFFAYNSVESGQYEVYVRPYPDHLAWRRQISTKGGWGPVWSPDGGDYSTSRATA